MTRSRYMAGGKKGDGKWEKDTEVYINKEPFPYI